MGTGSARRTVAVAGGVLVAVGLVVLGLAKATPDFYRRTERIGSDHPARDRFNEEVVNGVGNVLLDESGATRLDVTITEEMINARLVQFLEETRAAGTRLPSAVEALRVAFEPGRVILATRVGRGLSAMIISQHLRLSATPDGRVRVETLGLRVGLLPLPAAFSDSLARALLAAIEHLEAAGEGSPSRTVWRRVLQTLQGETVALGGKKLGIRLESIEIERGRLRARGQRFERRD